MLNNDVEEIVEELSRPFLLEQYQIQVMKLCESFFTLCLSIICFMLLKVSPRSIQPKSLIILLEGSRNFTNVAAWKNVRELGGKRIDSTSPFLAEIYRLNIFLVDKLGVIWVHRCSVLALGVTSCCLAYPAPYLVTSLWLVRCQNKTTMAMKRFVCPLE